MPGAAVLLDGATGHGVVTDENGKFKIVVPSSESILRFEFLGYSPVKMKVGNKTELNVTLNPDVSFLEEVVVIGRDEKQNGEVSIVAVVVPNKEECEAQGLTENEAIYNAINERVTEINKKLVAYKHINKVEMRDEPFEKTAAKKIKRFLIK